MSTRTGGFVAGIRFIATNPLLRAIVLLVTLTNAIDAAGMTVLKPVYATEVLHDPAMLGFMVGCFAAGALTGSAIFGVFGHRYSGRLMFATCFVLAGAPPYLAMALGAPLPVLLPVLALSGLAAGALNPMMATAMYGEVPDGMRARVFGATTAGVAASMPLGALLGGLSVEQFGLVPTLATCAALYLVLGGSPLFIRAFSGLTAARAHGATEADARTRARGIRPARGDHDRRLRRSADEPGAVDAERGGRACVEAGDGDALAAARADAVAAVGDARERPVDVGELGAHVGQHRGALRPLLRHRRALGVVLVVGRGIRSRDAHLGHRVVELREPFLGVGALRPESRLEPCELCRGHHRRRHLAPFRSRNATPAGSGRRVTRGNYD